MTKINAESGTRTYDNGFMRDVLYPSKLSQRAYLEYL